jgi:DNA-binding response OmpR family regulator
MRILLGDYEVLTAPTVKKGLELARIGGFDLYILDGTYPDGTGLELCEQIRTFDASTPILFFSGLAERSNIKAALSAGAQVYLRKPDDIDQLVTKVEQLLEGSSRT